MKTFVYTLLISAMVLFGTQVSFAGLIAVDDFESYTIGNSITNGSGGTGWGVNWDANASAVATVSEHTINYPMLIDGVSYTGGTNAVKCTGPSGVVDNFLERKFTSQSDTVYFGVLLERHFASSGDDIFMQFQLSNQSANNISYGGTSAKKGSIDVRARGSDGSITQTTESCVYNSDIVFVVAKLSKSSGNTGDNYDTAELFINPTSRMEPTADATVTRDMGTSELSYFALRSAYFSDTNYAYIDDIRIGTDFASVLSTAVPEPSAFALLLLGGITLGLVRRRSR